MEIEVVELIFWVFECFGNVVLCEMFVMGGIVVSSKMVLDEILFFSC